METIDKVEEMIKAGFPCFYILTEDEVSVEKAITDLGKKLERETRRWTCNSDNDLADTLKGIKGDPRFWIFINVHFFLEQPGVIQTIKDNLEEWKGTGNKVFFLENDKKIPPEINRDIAFVEFDLPGESELATTLDFVVESVKKQGLDVSEQLENGAREQITRAALGLTARQAEDAFSLSIIRTRGLDPKIVTEVKADEYLKSGLLELEEPMAGDKFRGYSRLQEYMRDAKEAFLTESPFGLPPPKGILLVGVPGTGKTLASRAVASIFNMMLLKVDLGKVFSEYVGSSERQIRTLISIAERMAPVVLRIDEIEKQMGGMGGGGNLDSGVGSRVLASLLSWLQDRTKPVFVVATANNIQSLRPELLRKGRFDEIFFLDLPSEEERIDIFGYHIESRIPGLIWLGSHPRNTQGWSGAEIEQVIIQALRRFEREHNTNLPTNDQSLLFNSILDEEIQRTVPLSVIRKEDIDAIRQWAISNNAVLASENKVIEEKQKSQRSLMLS